MARACLMKRGYVSRGLRGDFLPCLHFDIGISRRNLSNAEDEFDNLSIYLV